MNKILECNLLIMTSAVQSGHTFALWHVQSFDLIWSILLGEMEYFSHGLLTRL